jgi:hypothetical protein
MACLIFGMLLVACGDDDGLTIEDGQLKGQATLPLLPIDLPIFPTDVTLDGLQDTIEDELDDLLGWLNIYDNDDIEDFFEDVEKQVREASLEILQPGVLSVQVDNMVTETVRDYMEVTQVGVNFSFSNDTDKWVSVPVEFQLYLGDGALAEDWDASVMIPFVDPRVDENGIFVVAPGETIDLSIENVPHLVDALNESASIGIGYKALYRMADFNNGVDEKEVIEEFGLCLVEGLVAGSTSSCPSVSELLGWHLTLSKFELVISAESEITLPDIPGCSEVADFLNLDLLKEACPE